MPTAAYTPAWHAASATVAALTRAADPHGDDRRHSGFRRPADDLVAILGELLLIQVRVGIAKDKTG